MMSDFIASCSSIYKRCDRQASVYFDKPKKQTDKQTSNIQKNRNIMGTNSTDIKGGKKRQAIVC